MDIPKYRKPSKHAVKTIERFLTEYLNNGGNATMAAKKVFNCSTYESAKVLGSRYLDKSIPFARLEMEKQGITYVKLIQIAIEQMETSPVPDKWFDRLMKIGGYDVTYPQ